MPTLQYKQRINTIHQAYDNILIFEYPLPHLFKITKIHKNTQKKVLICNFLTPVLHKNWLDYTESNWYYEFIIENYIMGLKYVRKKKFH